VGVDALATCYLCVRVDSRSNSWLEQKNRLIAVDWMMLNIPFDFSLVN